MSSWETMVRSINKQHLIILLFHQSSFIHVHKDDYTNIFEYTVQRGSACIPISNSQNH